MDGGLYQNHEKDDHRHHTREAGRDGCTLNAEGRESELAEDESIVANDVQDIDNTHHNHRVYGLVNTAKHGRAGGLYRLNDGETADYLHVYLTMH